MTPGEFPFKVEVCGKETIIVEEERDPIEIDFVIGKT
jgi:hypothetical protein